MKDENTRQAIIDTGIFGTGLIMGYILNTVFGLFLAFIGFYIGYAIANEIDNYRNN